MTMIGSEDMVTDSITFFLVLEVEEIMKKLFQPKTNLFISFFK